MKKLLRGVGFLVLFLVGFAVVGVVAVYALSERRLQTVYPANVHAFAIPSDPAAVARGEHLVKSVGSCTVCHGPDLGGGAFADMGPVGVINASNLTRGRGGIGATFTDDDWIRAMRGGVRRDGTSLMVMPSEAFRHFTDEDLGAIIAYVKQLPPVDRELSGSYLKPLGRALLVSGKLDILVAPKTLRGSSREVVPPAATAEYGRYLADVSGCHECHGQGMAGGRVSGPPGAPPASNLTPTGIGSWREQEFFTAMRTGQRPDGQVMNELMPWRSFARMSDEELTALWLYLRSVPPREFGDNPREAAE